VIAAGSVTDAANQLSRHVMATRQLLEAPHLPDTVTGRLRGSPVDAWTPHVLLVNNPDPADLARLHHLRQDLAVFDRSGAALVVAPTHHEQLGDAIATVTADATLALTTPHLRATTAGAGLTAHELEK